MSNLIKLLVGLEPVRSRSAAGPDRNDLDLPLVHMRRMTECFQLLGNPGRPDAVAPRIANEDASHAAVSLGCAHFMSRPARLFASRCRALAGSLDRAEELGSRS